MEYEHFLTLLSFTATVSTFGMFLCGLQICTRIHKRGSTDGTGVSPFYLTSVSCICWLGYGVLRGDHTVMFVNGIGLVFQSVYLAYYYMKTRLKMWLNRLIFSELIISVLTASLVNSETVKLDEKENILGVICMFLNIATIASPLVDVRQVIRTRSTESMPLMLCFANMAVSAQWLLYGILMDDFYMKVPNGIGTLISVLQLSLFIIYPREHNKMMILSSDKTDV